MPGGELGRGGRIPYLPRGKGDLAKPRRRRARRTGATGQTWEGALGGARPARAARGVDVSTLGQCTGGWGPGSLGQGE